MSAERRHVACHPRRALAAVCAILLLLGACSEDMGDQHRADTLEPSGFFEDGTSHRPPVPGTVPRGALEASAIDGPGAEITIETVRIGQRLFNGICAACHGRDGYGEGVVVQRGFPAPPSLHEPRLREAGDDHLRRVIEHGQGKMPSYSSQLDGREREAVIAYIRALQLSQHAEVAALPEEVKEGLRQASQGVSEEREEREEPERRGEGVR